MYVDNLPLYLYAPGKYAERMARRVPAPLHPQLRFIVLVREPVTRALSQIHHQRRVGCKWWCEDGMRGRVSEEDLVRELSNTTVDAVVRSQYAEHLRAWFKHFPRNQFLVLSMERMLSDVAAMSQTLERIASFLAVDTWDPRVLQRAVASDRGPGGHNASSARQRAGDAALRRFNCSAQTEITDAFAASSRSLSLLLASTLTRAPPEQEPFRPFPDPRSPECISNAPRNPSPSVGMN